MTKAIWTGTFSAIVGAAAIVALAQAPPPAAPQQNSSTSSAKRITVTGCLKAAPAEAAEPTATGGATGTTGTTGSAAAGATGTTGASSDQTSAKFVLADATIAAAPGQEAAASGSTASTSPQTAPEQSAASQSHQTYRLMANPAALTPHVGKKLELTGTLVEDASSAPATGAASQTASASQGPLLKVESGKVIAASCQE